MKKSTQKVYYKNLHKSEQYGKSKVEIFGRWDTMYPDGYTCIPNAILYAIFDTELFNNYERMVLLYIWQQTIGKMRTMFQQDFDIDDILTKFNLGKKSVDSIKRAIVRLDEMNIIHVYRERKAINIDKQVRLCIKNRKTKITINDDMSEWKLGDTETRDEKQTVSVPVKGQSSTPQEEEKLKGWDYEPQTEEEKKENERLLKELEDLE